MLDGAEVWSLDSGGSLLREVLWQRLVCVDEHSEDAVGSGFGAGPWRCCGEVADVAGSGCGEGCGGGGVGGGGGGGGFEAGFEAAFEVCGEVVFGCYGWRPAGGGYERVFGHGGEAAGERRVRVRGGEGIWLWGGAGGGGGGGGLVRTGGRGCGARLPETRWAAADEWERAYWRHGCGAGGWAEKGKSISAPPPHHHHQYPQYPPPPPPPPNRSKGKETPSPK